MELAWDSQKKNLDEKFRGQKLLLNGSIYGKSGPPDELRGKLFQYSVITIVASTKEKSQPQFRCKYKDIIIDEGGDAWQSWPEKGNDPSYLMLSMKAVEEAVELYM